MPKKVATVGGQDGDEGKGKIINFLTESAAQLVKESEVVIDEEFKPILVMRYQGGSNAGHTIQIGNEVYKLHLVPSGISTAEAYNFDGGGVYIIPQVMMQEIEGLRARGVHVSGKNFGIASNAHVTLEYHTDDDQASFRKEHHTSTGRGIKQTAADKANRVGIRFVEFLNPDAMRDALERKFNGNPLAKFGIGPLIEFYAEQREFLREFLALETDVLRDHGHCFQLFEGAQGISLDMDVGRYPGVTSTNPAFVPHRPNTVLGVFKLYKSSVGTGDRHFVTRIPDRDLESALVDAWGERGTTTGKARELGYFDVVEARYSIDAADIDFLVGTCGDRLEEFARRNEKVKLVVAYRIKGRVYDKWDPTFHDRTVLPNAEPIFEEFEPWQRFQEDGRLTDNAQRYIDRIQALTGKEFAMLGTGPKQDDMIVYNDPLVI